MGESPSMPNLSLPQPTWEALARYPALAVLVDLDGVLIPFAATHELAPLDDGAARLLRALDESGVQVVVISGRPWQALDALRPIAPGAWWIAEHGAWRFARGSWQPPAASAELGDLVQRFSGLVAATAGSRIERKTLALAVHWRQVARTERRQLIEAAESIIEDWLEHHPDFDRLDGADVLEVRHCSANKGIAVSWLREQLPPETRLIAFGDEMTDEEAFAALADGDASIVVGESAGLSRADWWVAGTDQTRELLMWIAEARSVPGLRPPVPVHARAGAEPKQHDLLIVSNRTPMAATIRGKEVGGVVSALAPIVQRRGGSWLGWSGQERAPGLELVVDEVPPARATFDYPPGWRHQFYGGFCNRSLWPLMHCFPGRVRYVDAEWTAYVEANEAYARFAHQLVTSGGTVWVHDYHLMLVGSALRHLGHTGPIGFFLHVPFPPRDVWETLPWHLEMMDAMQAYDLVGFHTERWADNFRMALAAAHRGGVIATTEPTAIESFPIGIEPELFRPRPDQACPDDVEGLRGRLGERKLLLGVDRLDYSKGIPERLEAFRRLIELYPQWKGKVSFVQISVPSRSDVPEYAELRRRVEELVGRINGELGEADWMPVQYLYRSYEPQVLAQLYRMADVGVVTPLRDGMNLVAKEFVVAQNPDRPGVLLLSRFAGAAEELDAAILTNPYHADGVAADLDRALRMPFQERLERHTRLLQAATAVTSSSWAESFLRRLSERAAMRPSPRLKQP